MIRFCSGICTSGYPLPLEGGQGGIARTGGYNEMRHIAFWRSAKAASRTILLQRPIPGSQASLPLPEEGALRGSIVMARLEKHGDEMHMQGFCSDGEARGT